MELHFITHNPGKIASATRILKEYGVKVIPFDIPSVVEPREYDPRKVVEQKIAQVAKNFSEPFMVSDAAFFVHSLNGFPGTFTNHMLDTIKVEGLLKLLEGKDRRCEFRQCLGYLESNTSQPKIFEWSVSGIIAEEPRGVFEQDYHWSDLARVFIPNNSKKTLAEMTKEEHDEWRENVRPSEFDMLGEHLTKG